MTLVSLNDYLERCRNEIMERCTGCGNCVAHCEIRPFTALRNTDPMQLVRAVTLYLETGEFDQLAYDFAFQCINCLECTTHCPERLEASALTVLAKNRFVKDGYDAPPLLKIAQPCQSHSYQNILAAMQTKPADVWWLENVPRDVEPHEVVLFLGCHEMIFPHSMAATRDILAALELDFVSVGGGKNLCCGAVHMNTADPATAHDMGRNLVESLERFRPKTVIFTCPTCVYMIRKTASGESGLSPVRYVHLSQFLAERLRTIPLVKPLRGRFTIQDPCFTGRGLGDYDSPRRVISAIKGVELVEMKHNHERALCCGASALGNPEVGRPFIRNRLQEARDAGADTVVNLCAGCQLAFFRCEKEFRLESKTFSEAVAEAMGIEITQDKMKCFRDLGSPDLILESARESLNASPYGADDVGPLLPFLF